MAEGREIPLALCQLHTSHVLVQACSKLFILGAHQYRVTAPKGNWKLSTASHTVPRTWPSRRVRTSVTRSRTSAPEVEHPQVRSSITWVTQSPSPVEVQPGTAELNVLAMVPGGSRRNSLWHTMPSVLKPPTFIPKEHGSVHKWLPDLGPMAKLHLPW